MSGPGLYLFAGAFLYWISGELRKISIKHKSVGPCHPIMARSDSPGRRIIGMAAKGKRGSQEETIEQITQSKLQVRLIVYAAGIIASARLTNSLTCFRCSARRSILYYDLNDGCILLHDLPR